MAAEGFAVDTDALDRDAEELRSEVRRMEAELDGVAESVAALNRMWQGAAKDSMAERIRREEGRLREICASFRALADDIQDAGAAYTKGDAEVDQAFSSIRY